MLMCGHAARHCQTYCVLEQMAACTKTLLFCPQMVSGAVSWFDAGKDADGFTLAYTDADRDFCAQVRALQLPVAGMQGVSREAVLCHMLHARVCIAANSASYLNRHHYMPGNTLCAVCADAIYCVTRGPP
jgi:hypothetical protein